LKEGCPIPNLDNITKILKAKNLNKDCKMLKISVLHSSHHAQTMSCKDLIGGLFDGGRLMSPYKNLNMEYFN
jgi:hypothetical protein